jgi:uncharacterized damage-inducible protein DinB
MTTAKKEMTMSTGLQEFSRQWQIETRGTLVLLRALPPDSYDRRSDPGGRSIGELAWHLGEVDAYVTFGIERGSFAFDEKPPNIQRPRTIEALAPAFEVVHQDAVARVARLSDADLDRSIQYADDTPWTIRDLLWRKLLLHAVHHRGQLTSLCRLAGGVPPALYGPAREETAARHAAAAAH